MAAGNPGGLGGPFTKSLKLLNARTLQPIWEHTAGPGPSGLIGDRGVQYRSDRFLSKISGWPAPVAGMSSHGVQLLVRRDRGFEQLLDEHSQEGYLAMGDDGNIYTESGKVLSDDPNRNEQRAAQSMPMPPPSGMVSRGSISNGRPFPGMGGVFLLVLDDNATIHLLEASTRSVITELGTLPAGFLPEGPKAEAKEDPFQRLPNTPGFPGAVGFPSRQPAAVLAPDKRVIFVPELGYILFVPYTNDKLVVRPFDVKEAVQDTEGVLLITSVPATKAQSGAEWQYQVTAIAHSTPLKISLAKAPQGMTITDAGMISWAIPGGIEGAAAVIVEVTDESGSVKQQRFTISFK